MTEPFPPFHTYKSAMLVPSPLVRVLPSQPHVTLKPFIPEALIWGAVQYVKVHIVTDEDTLYGAELTVTAEQAIIPNLQNGILTITNKEGRVKICSAYNL